MIGSVVGPGYTEKSGKNRSTVFMQEGRRESNKKKVCESGLPFCISGYSTITVHGVSVISLVNSGMDGIIQ